MHLGELTPLAIPPRTLPQLTPPEALVIGRLNKILKRSRPTTDEIKRAVCEHYQVSRLEIESHNRFALFVGARCAFCYFAFRYTRASLRLIGIRVGGLDHTTVHHNIRKVAQAAFSNAMFRADLDLLQMRIIEKVLARQQEAADASRPQ